MALHQRLRAVVAGADGDALAVEQRGQVVGVDLAQREGDHAAAPLGRRPVDGEIGNRAEPLQRVGVSACSWAWTRSMPSALR